MLIALQLNLKHTHSVNAVAKILKSFLTERSTTTFILGAFDMVEISPGNRRQKVDAGQGLEIFR